LTQNGLFEKCEAGLLLSGSGRLTGNSETAPLPVHDLKCVKNEVINLTPLFALLFRSKSVTKTPDIDEFW
jgi:hypothetical protein